MRDALGWAVPILWPVKVVTLPARGPRPTLKGEVRITLRLLEDVEVPAAVVTSRTASRVPEASQFRSSSTAMSTASSTLSAEEQAHALTFSPFADRPSGEQVTMLMLKDGTGYLASDYWLEAGELRYLTPNGKYKLLPLARLALEETVKLNRQRNVEFVLHSQGQ
jgi:hypothetical protein